MDTEEIFRPFENYQKGAHEDNTGKLVFFQFFSQSVRKTKFYVTIIQLKLNSMYKHYLNR